MKKTYSILNAEGNILLLQIENNEIALPQLYFLANLKFGKGRVILSISDITLLKYFNSQLTLGEIISGSHDKQFIIRTSQKVFIVEKSFLVDNIECGDIRFADFPKEMRMPPDDVIKIYDDNNLGIFPFIF